MGFLNGMMNSPMTGSVIGAAGSLMEGFAGGQAADFQAQIAKNNAEIAQYNAQGATEVGRVQALNSALRTRAVVGQTKAAQAASGIDVNSGSALDVQASERMLGMLDALTIRSNAARAAYGYKAEAAQQTARAGFMKQRGKMSRLTGLMNASGTILEGATSADRQRRIWQDTNGSLDDEGDLPSFGSVARF